MDARLLRFLIAEPNDDHYLIAERTLKRSRVGNTFARVKTGADALEQLRSGASAGRPFDVVLLDSRLSDVSGEELLRMIKRESPVAEVHVAMMVTMPTDVQRMQKLEAPPDAFISKPVTRLQLARLVRQLGYVWGVFRAPE